MSFSARIRHTSPQKRIQNTPSVNFKISIIGRNISIEKVSSNPRFPFKAGTLYLREFWKLSKRFVRVSVTSQIYYYLIPAIEMSFRARLKASFTIGKTSKYSVIKLENIDNQKNISTGKVLIFSCLFRALLNQTNFCLELSPLQGRPSFVIRIIQVDQLDN